MSWLKKILNEIQIQARSDLTVNSPGTPGGNIGAPLTPGQSSIFVDPKRRRKRRVNQKDDDDRKSPRRYNVDQM